MQRELFNVRVYTHDVNFYEKILLHFSTIFGYALLRIQRIILPFTQSLIHQEALLISRMTKKTPCMRIALLQFRFSSSIYICFQEPTHSYIYTHTPAAADNAAVCLFVFFSSPLSLSGRRNLVRASDALHTYRVCTWRARANYDRTRIIVLQF